MPVLFNNRRGRPHETIFGEGAFFDLYAHGRQAKLAVGLKRGVECAVAGVEPDGSIRFNWYRFAREELREDEGEKVRVFFGEFVRDEVMSKAEAAKSVKFESMFNTLGHFKRVSAVESGEA